MVPVKAIRRNWKLIPEFRGIYKWWFPEDVTLSLFSNIKSKIDMSKIEKTVINDKVYYSLYVGKAEKESIMSRIMWHVDQEHTRSTVVNGLLSTLRQTISALLRTDMIISKDAVNNIMDHALLQFYEVPRHLISNKEMEMINGEYLLPLNIQGNKNVNIFAPGLKQELRRLRKVYRR